MSIEEKFRAAVNVIRSLPKNGAFQPSHDLMLRFYAYFKQATEGPCKGSRPAFWEVVAKVKYDAWAKLGNMPAEEAMKNYVDELKQIVETMSYTENVAKFMGSLDSVYEAVPAADLELLLGPTIERMRSMPGSPIGNSPLGSRETSPTRAPISSSLGSTPASSESASPQRHPGSSDEGADECDDDDDDDDEEEFIDTVEVSEFVSEKLPSIRNNYSQMNGGIHHKFNGDVLHHSSNAVESEIHDRSRGRERGSPTTKRRNANQAQSSDISEQMRDVVLHLQRDLDRITARVRSLEVASLSRVPASLEAHQTEYDPLVESCASCEDIRRHAEVLTRARTTRYPSWWPFKDLSPRAVLFITAWPVVIHIFMLWLQRRRAALSIHRSL
ncbi:Acyl-CoA-binding domain-containing protein 5 [Frankliniella fusca]|uniref:Acyl-CoA-binding domain-containing protein 5 n=1 Tax=Frankliniella fusca TaxID=407009 RepID=A0AAE1LTF2_9NEOP|nr:Acyl-CoA-binding domain-containing protein 5 [Frankliniella fusca]